MASPRACRGYPTPALTDKQRRCAHNAQVDIIYISRRPLRGTPSPHSPCTFIFSVAVYVSRCQGDAIRMRLAQLSRRRRAICGRSSAKLAYLTFVAEVSGWRQTDFDGCRGFGQALARVTNHDTGRRPFRE